QHGADVVAKELPSEWDHFERPTGVIDLKLTIRRARLDVDGDFATAEYWVEVAGGSRWKFSEVGLVFQAFARKDGRWKLAFQTDSWNLDYDPVKLKPGRETFEFDAVYPVKNLKRAIEFYTPILGKPEIQREDHATFNLCGSRFHLDATCLGGLAPVREG